MAHRVITNEAELASFITLLAGLKLPVTVEWTKGRVRSSEQNKLQRMWCNEIAEQLGDQTPEEIRGFCKLTMAVPILRAEDEEFRIAYDRVVRDLPYETKLACMMEPIDFPVTRRMTVKQKAEFLDHMQRFWAERGVQLTETSASNQAARA